MNTANLHSGLKSHALNKPNDIAVVYYDKSQTFLELYERVNGLANALIKLGLKKGDHIVISMKNRMEMVEIYYAISTIGAVAVPINYMVEGEALIQLINNSHASYVFLENERLDAYEKIIDNLNLVKPETMILVGNRSNVNYLNYETLIIESSSNDPMITVTEDDMAFILYSSGTTSAPKGIIRTQGIHLKHLLFTAIEWNVNYKDVILISVPMYHSVGHLYNFYLSLFGCKLVITREFKPEEVLRNIEKHKVTHSFMVPTQYIRVLEDPALNKYDLSSIRLLCSAAAPLSEATKKNMIKTFNCDITEFLGTTETGPFTSLRPHEIFNKTSSVGKQADFANVKLIDDAGNEVGIDEPGEFAVKTPLLFNGYYQNEEETKKSILPGGWFLTGDIGKKDKDGFYYIVDRKKDMIISGGVNIYSRDIEEVLYKHPLVSEAAVIGIPHEIWGEAVKAFVVLKAEGTITEEELMNYANMQLAKYQNIKELEIISSLPRNPSGKILKRSLRKTTV